jgi:NhaP-type Na+/H+ or K+/H+ antiporter
MEYTIIILVLGGLALGLGIGIVLWRNRWNLNQGEPNYKAFFIIGTTFLSLGIVLSAATDNPGLIGISGLGVAYLAIGLKNRDKW